MDKLHVSAATVKVEQISFICSTSSLFRTVLLAGQMDGRIYTVYSIFSVVPPSPFGRFKSCTVHSSVWNEY